MAEERLPTDEELREALGKVRVADVLVDALTAAVSLGFHRLSPEARDLDQARLAIEALRALDPLLREAGVDEALVRDLEQARANLQLAYASAVAGSPPASEPRGPGDAGAATESDAEAAPPGTDGDTDA